MVGLANAAIEAGAASRFDPLAYVHVEGIAAAVVDAPGWAIEVHEKRPRPPGAASASHHIDDTVLRAKRTSGH